MDQEDNTSHSIDSKPYLNFTSLRTSDSGNYTCRVTINTTNETSVSGENILGFMVAIISSGVDVPRGHKY